MLVIFYTGGNPFYVGAALAFIIWSLKEITGGLVNPAVTLGVWLNKGLSTQKLAGFIAIQFLAIVAAYSLYKALGL